MKLGFAGLGHLGKAIAGRLIECNHELKVWNRTASKADGLAAEVAPTLMELTKDAEIICLCMFDSAAVKSLLSDEDGLLAGDVAGKIILDFTTNHFKEVLEFHTLCAQAGCSYLEAPVLGSVVPASQGTLTMVVSGEAAAYDAAQGVLSNLAAHLFHLAEPGMASRMKLINNLCLGSFMATLAEALALGEKSGLDREQVLDILAVGGGNSLVLNAKKAKLIDQDFSTHFSNALIHKDLHCLQDLAYDIKAPLFTGAVVKELFAKTYEAGIDQEDFSAIYKLFAK